jgi:FeS assembly protein SufD
MGVKELSMNLISKPNELETRNLNPLTVPTWRWLKVNSLALKNFKVPEILRYQKKFIKDGDFENITIMKMDHTDDVVGNLNYLISSREDYGVDDGLVALGEKSYNSGVFVHVLKGIKSQNPIRLEYVLDDRNPAVIDNNIITAEENSEVTVIMDYSSADSDEAFHNGVTRVYARRGSKVNIIKIQRMNDNSRHFDSNAAYIGYGARVNWIEVILGGKESITNTISNLEETESEANLGSIYFGDGSRTIDLSYLMNHKGRRTVSNIETKGALKDMAKKVFKGTIDFKLGASKSKGSEEEYALLLDKDVKASSVPLLLCSEDDVEGQHAASAGQIDNEKLFYIMSRGFNEKEAKKLIVEAYFAPIIDKIPCEDLRDIIRNEIQRRLVHA